ncbi:hypothetical protein EBV26_19255, partial [bacterium]|nr:hypothetical protein [bacterium]
MANIIFNCNTCNDNSPIQLVANDELVPLYYGIQSQKIIGLNNDGSFNDSFIYENGFNNPVWVTVSQNDGKILVGGEFTTYNLTTSNSIVRLNSDGSIDNTFVIGSGFNGTVLAIAIQSDGKILIGGQFNNYNGVGANRIIRLNSDGSVDNTFAYGSGFNDIVYTITIQNDGKILVGGYFLSYNGTGANRIIRLNPDGSIDNTFVYGSGFTLMLNPATVFIITIQLDGKILVGGQFSNYNGTNVNNIIRLNQNGSVDNTFIIGLGFDNYVTTIAIQSDGKILVGGSFTNYDVTSAYSIIRLNADGSVDNTFVYGSGFNSSVNVIVIQSDGKILIGGYFITYNNMVSPYIIRLNTDGTIDESLDTKNGLDNVVRSLTIKNDQSLIIGGQFSSYNSRQIRNFIRLNTNGLYD